jgi:hypothetical protein
MLEDSRLLGKHMCVRFETSQINFDAEFGPKDFRMIHLCIKRDDITNHHSNEDFSFGCFRLFRPANLLADASIEMILPDENDGWLKYSFDGRIMIPQKEIHIEIVNREAFNVNHNMSDENILKKVVFKQEKINGKTDPEATISIRFKIVHNCDYFACNFILKFHLQK